VAKTKKEQPDLFVDWFRSSSPYIHAHRGRTFVIVFGGEAVESEGFSGLIHDIALLHGLGIRLVLVHGARPQIEERLRLRGAEMQYVDGLRITDDTALACVKEAAGTVRVEIEALLSMGLANSPMAGARIKVASGNFVTARPFGVRNGVDYCHTGEVRRVDTEAIRQIVESGTIALMPPLGYSPTGEVFNLSAPEVGSAVAIALGADKLISLVEGKGLTDSRGRLLTNVVPRKVDDILKRRTSLPEDLVHHLRNAVTACRSGVKRTHLVSRYVDGGLLKELFTRDGAILELLAPLEEQGVLVRRSRELLEGEIDRFTVMERDGMAIGCAALYCYPKERMAELACVAVHPDYRNGGRGDSLMAQMETRARQAGMKRIFVLTTHTAHWFRERGFKPSSLEDLPVKRRELYNYRRNSKVFFKTLD
jgi:amino-acid N-acetyltransferase